MMLTLVVSLSFMLVSLAFAFGMLAGRAELRRDLRRVGLPSPSDRQISSMSTKLPKEKS